MLKSDALVVKVGTTQTLICDGEQLTDPGYPVYTTFDWVWNGEKLATTEPILKIHPVLVTDGGKYTCAARNLIGPSAYSTQLVVSVEGKLRPH